MFDGIPQSNLPPGRPGATRANTRASRAVIIAIVLALSGMALTVMRPGDFSEGFHMEFIAP